MTASAERVVHAACPHDCPDSCAMLVTVRDGRAVQLIGDPDHPVTRGFLCAKVSRYLDRVYSDQRLLHPLRRVGAKGEGRFERISWEEALTTITDRWRQVIAEHGPQAILRYRYLGNQGVVAYWAGDRVFNLLGASQLETNICGGGGFAGQLLAGVSGIDPEDAVHSRLIIVWGVNVLSTNVHLWPFIQEARKRGARLVVIDPLRSRTAAHADERLAIRPGTDGALALGLMHVILAEGLEDHAYVAEHTAGIEQLRARAAEYPPERVSALCGLPAEQIASLARAYATTRPAFIRYGVGMMRAAGAGAAVRAVVSLAALCGHWRERGGGVLGLHGSLSSLNRLAVQRPDLAPAGTRAINQIKLGEVLTDPTLDPPIQTLYVYNSNPAVVNPDSHAVRAGLARPDLFTVVHEQFLTETAAYADIVLPAPTQLEQTDAVGSWGQRHVIWNEQAIAPLGEARSNWDTLRAIGRRLGLDDPLLDEEPEELVAGALAAPGWEEDAFAQLRERGSLRSPMAALPHAEGRFRTPSGKFEFFSETWQERTGDALPRYVPPAESAESDPALAARLPLHLVTPHTHGGPNTSYSDLPRFRAIERSPRLTLHPQDASERGLCEGDTARIFNDRGELTLAVAISEDVRPGVVAVPFGWTGEHAVNVLTSMRAADLGGGPTFGDVLVQVERV